MADLFKTLGNFAETIKEVSPDSKTILKTGQKVAQDTAVFTKELTEKAVQDVTKEKESAELDKEIEYQIGKYNRTYEELEEAGRQLYMERLLGVELIGNIEMLVNSIANRPKEFDKDIAEIEEGRKQFTGAAEFAAKELNAAKGAANEVVAGALAGGSFAVVAPSAAMWVATTFGTASTGAAISSLSGAAATNAAMAWLGGGAVAAGGHGIAGGGALLALSGPVGWGIAGAAALTSVVVFTKKKSELNQEKVEEIKKIKENTKTTKESAAKINDYIIRTDTLKEQLKGLYAECMYAFGRDYNEIDRELKIKLGAMVNNTKSLSAILGAIE